MKGYLGNGCHFDYGQTGRRSLLSKKRLRRTEQFTREAGGKSPGETDWVFLVPDAAPVPVKTGFSFLDLDFLGSMYN